MNWISLDERKPARCQRVLVYRDRLRIVNADDYHEWKFVYIGRYTQTEWSNDWIFILEDENLLTENQYNYVAEGKFSHWAELDVPQEFR